MRHVGVVLAIIDRYNAATVSFLSFFNTAAAAKVGQSEALHQNGCPLTGPQSSLQYN